jgi:integrase
MMASIEAPIVANQTLAAVSAIFSWALKEEILPANPCKLVARNATKSRERVLSDTEVPVMWLAFDDAELIVGSALKLILLLGQRPGEVAHMRHEHIKDGWWEMPGDRVPSVGWPGTKNGTAHRVWVPKPAVSLIADVAEEGARAGFVLAGRRGGPVRGLDHAMRAMCRKLQIERAMPHDLRRTHGTTIAALGFGRDAMNRVQNHREGGIGSVYDRHSYAEENKRIMEAVAQHLLSLAERGTADSNVVQIGTRNSG